MVMLTQTLRDGSYLLAKLMIDQVQLMNVGQPVTVGAQVTRALTPVGQPIQGLVQSVSLENAVEGRVNQMYSVKLPLATVVNEGMAVKVISCAAEPQLVGQVILLDTVSRNGLAMLRKATGQVSRVVNTEGKEALA